MFFLKQSLENKTKLKETKLLNTIANFCHDSYSHDRYESQMIIVLTSYNHKNEKHEQK